VNEEILDILWLTISCALVLLMQAGFLCVESGATRSKNAINVAMKNAADFVVAVFLFWLVGFALMFGNTFQGLIGSSQFMAPVGHDAAFLSSFFLFQAMFCATAVTIVSGVIAERVRFNSYLVLSILVAAFIYPVSGHWAWGGAMGGAKGWLAARGFVDFAGSTVVHSVGGWVGLAALLVVGPRHGRFVDGQAQPIPGSNAPLALLGLLFFVVGWIGFNGGSTLALNERVPGIIANTLLAAVAGGLVTYLVCLWRPAWCADALMVPMNGVLAGLVSITANCHAVTSTDAVLIGGIGGLVMLAVDHWMVHRGLDDAIGAVPVHLGAGIWGTLAVALFGDPQRLGTGLDFWQQLSAQLAGIAVIGLWSFVIAWLLVRLYNRWHPLRVSAEDEYAGLNVSEHGARNELVQLLGAMDQQERSSDLSYRVPVEPFTEIGQIAARHNRIMDALQKAVTQTRAIVRDIRDGILTFGPDGVLTSFNPGAEKVFGVSAAMAIGQPFYRLLHADTAPAANDEEAHPLAMLPLGQTSELLGRRHDDSPFFMEVTVTESSDAGQPHYTAVVRDIHDKRRVEEQLYNEKERALVTLESIVDGVITTDAEGNIDYVNNAAEQLTGWSRLLAEGEPFSHVYRIRDDNAFQDSAGMLQRALQGATVHAETHALTLTARDGSERAVMHTAAPITNSRHEVIGMVIVFHDVTSARELQQQLSHQATHDALTGMLNRNAFETRAVELLTHAKQEAGEHMLAYLDLDQFKLVNDTCGHIAGDELLRQVAALIKAQLRADDVVARLGGDEFGILLRRCDQDNGMRIAEKIREAIHDFRFPWENQLFSIGVSIGLVNISRHTESLSRLLSIADAACYAAKDMGRNRVHLYQPNDMELARRQGQMQWVTRIREALDRDRLRLYFQTIAPIGEARSQSGHYEIFVRMLDEYDNVVPPGAFIPAAERYNLMQEIDLWVIRNALAWLGDQQRRSGPNTIELCALNLSGASVGDDTCLNEIRDFFKRYQVDARHVCFEITETAAIANLRSATRFIKDLKAIGCRFALDDFGSGLSSFGYLKNLPVDYLKIDGAFIKDIANSAMDKVMVQSINTIGHQMGLKTVAEFVESASILQTLKDIGLDFVQGYHIDRPRPLEQLEGVIFMPR
jgi:Amt family ammonium transporter